MFRTLTKGLRTRAAMTLIATYVLCLMAPHAALALSNGAMAIHCLDVLDEMPAGHDHAAMNHSHADGMIHAHHDDGSDSQHKSGSGKAHSSNCCGVFCMSAVANDSAINFGSHVVHSTEFAAPVANLIGDDPDLPYRPPNV